MIVNRTPDLQPCSDWRGEPCVPAASRVSVEPPQRSSSLTVSSSHTPGWDLPGYPPQWTAWVPRCKCRGGYRFSSELSTLQISVTNQEKHQIEYFIQNMHITYMYISKHIFNPWIIFNTTDDEILWNILSIKYLVFPWQNGLTFPRLQIF